MYRFYLIGTVIANDNVDLVVSVNPNNRLRGGPAGNSSSPFIRNNNISGNTTVRRNDGEKDVDVVDITFNGVGNNILSNNMQNSASESVGLVSVKSITPSPGSCNSRAASPHRKLVAK